MIRTYDELNIIDWPLSLFKDDELEITGEVRRYQIFTWNRINKNKLSGYLKIWFLDHEDGNCLKPYDEDVLLVLISFSAETYFSSQILKFSSKNDILDRLGWSRSGFSYKKLSCSLTRLRGITFETNIYYNKALNVYETRKFGLIESVSWDRLSYGKNVNKRKKGVFDVEIIWSSTMWTSFNVGNIRPFDLEFYLSIKNPQAKKLFRSIDKRVYKTKRSKIPVSYLGINVLGMNPSNTLKHMMIEIGKATDILVEKGFLSAAMFVRDKKGIMQLEVLKNG